MDRQAAMDCARSLLAFMEAAGRGVAAFLGIFTLLNLAGEVLSQNFDATVWWIDVRGIQEPLRSLWLLVLAILLVRFAITRSTSQKEKLVCLAALLPALLIAVRDAGVYQTLLNQQILHSDSLISFSAVMVGCLCVILLPQLIRISVSDARFPRSDALQLLPVLTAVGCFIGFPLLQIHCFGWTDYRREADAAVVFGCHVYADGRLSYALEDRVRSGIDLYQAGLVQYLIMTGGPGDGDVHETEAMRDFADAAGVPRERILIDRNGWNTDRSVSETVPLFHDRHFEKVLAVSHSFHLPRIKLAYARQGWDVFTVPAHQQYRLRNESFLLARETAALWAYYLRPITGL